MVNIGGGYVDIEEYYDKYSYSQSVALYRLIKQQGLTFMDALTGLLDRHLDTEMIIAYYLS